MKVTDIIGTLCSLPDGCDCTSIKLRDVLQYLYFVRANQPQVSKSQSYSLVADSLLSLPVPEGIVVVAKNLVLR